MKGAHLTDEGILRRGRRIAALLGNVNTYQRVAVLHVISESLVAQKRESLASALDIAAAAYGLLPESRRKK